MSPERSPYLLTTNSMRHSISLGGRFTASAKELIVFDLQLADVRVSSWPSSFVDGGDGRQSLVFYGRRAVGGGRQRLVASGYAEDKTVWRFVAYLLPTDRSLDCSHCSPRPAYAPIRKWIPAQGVSAGTRDIGITAADSLRWTNCCVSPRMAKLAGTYFRANC